MQEDKGQWKLLFGMDAGTVESCDAGSQQHPSLEVCKSAFAGEAAVLKSLGYSISFANAIAPDGTIHHLHGTALYR